MQGVSGGWKRGSDRKGWPFGLGSRQAPGLPAVHGQVGAFVVGFGCCALLARTLLFPQPVYSNGYDLTPAASSGASVRGGNLADVVAQCEQSVVNLEVYTSDTPAGGGLPGWLRLSKPEEPDSVASGVILSEQGYVVTNNHVVEGATRVKARLVDGRELTATLVGRDPMTDLAVLRIRSKRLGAARLADSRKVRAGDAVIAIGNPLGFESSVSTGIVSSNRKGPFRVDGKTLGDMIQTDAAINQGNSGGGLFDTSGRLVGINTAIMVARAGGGSIGIGFALPTHRVQQVVDRLIHEGRVSRPFLGIRYTPPRLPGMVRRLTEGPGVLVEDVVPGGPAARAGLRANDLLRGLGQLPIRNADDLYCVSDRYRPGQKVTARVLRAGQEQRVTLVLGEG